MGKKKKNKNKYFKTKKVKSFLFDNKVLLAALGGAAAGISLAAALGTEKAKQIIDNINEGARQISDKINNGFVEETDFITGRKSNKKVNQLEKEPS